MNTETTNPEPPIIELVDAAVAAYGGDGPPLIEGINWRVMRGDYWVVGAAHGSGATDLLSMAAGLIRPTAGDTVPRPNATLWRQVT